MKLQVFSQINCQKELYDDEYVSSDKFVCKMIFPEIKKKIKFTKVASEKNLDPNFTDGYLWKASYKESTFFFIKSDNPNLSFLTFAIIKNSGVKIMSKDVRIGMSKKAFMSKMQLHRNICNTFSIINDSSFVEFYFSKDKLVRIKVEMGS